LTGACNDLHQNTRFHGLRALHADARWTLDSDETVNHRTTRAGREIRRCWPIGAARHQRRE
jgi:succinate dehydrogenase/fumarate reductase-like Fe-S protein